MSTFLDKMGNKLLPQSNDVGTARNHCIETNAVFFHVIQQVDNRNNLFSVDSARHRNQLMKNLCEHFGIIPIINVIMPTHTHDVFLTDDVKKIQQMFRNLNRGTSVFIKKERLAKYGKKTDQVFSRYPGFKAIKNREQFFNLIKYLYDNPVYLKENGEFVPFSCFDLWEKGYFKPYKPELFNQLFVLEIEKILELCRENDKVQFAEISKKRFGNDSPQESDQIFKRDPSEPWKIQ